MKRVFFGLLVLAGLASGELKAAVDNEVLKEGVQDICGDYGGDYWDAGDGTFGCEIDDMDTDILCVENSGCTVFDAAPASRPVTRSVTAKVALARATLLTARTKQELCGRTIRDHRAGRPSEVLQKKVCKKLRLPVPSARP